MTRVNWKKFDWILLGIVLLLVTVGIVMVQSTTASSASLAGYGKRQALFALVGLVLLALATIVDYHVWKTLRWGLYFLLLASLAVVVVMGNTQGGAQRWLSIGPLLLQPSELAKILAILFFASFLSDHGKQIEHFWGLLWILFLLIPPLILIYWQPDLGTAISVAFVGILLLFLGGARWRHLALLSGAGLLSLPLLWLKMQDYMRRRLLSFLDPAKMPNYHVHQALISVGSGGWFGQGLGHGSQSSLHFLPVRHTDFIFSVIAEELGLIGAAIVVLLLALLIVRIWQDAQKVVDKTGLLIISGVGALLFFQVVINVGMNVGLMPVTGIPLPFISYGGSSLLSFLFAMGLIESVLIHQREISFR